MPHALEVYDNDRLIFHSDGKWLHPLFELHDFLNDHDYDPATLRVCDKIVGRAAALLMVQIGVRHVHAAMLSRRGQTVLEHFGVKYTHTKLVDKILCQTEDILQDELDPSAAYALLKERANRTRKAS